MVAGTPAPDGRGALVRQLRSLVAGSLVRQAAVYTLSSLIGKAIPFLLLPVLTRYLSPADYGIVTMFMFAALLLDPFVSLGLAGAVSVKYFEPEVDLPTFSGTGLQLMLMVAVPAELVVFVVREPASALMQVPAEWLLLIVPLIVARTVTNVLLTVLRVRERALLFAVVQNLQSAGLMGLSLFLVVGLGQDWRGRAGAELIAWLAFGLIGFLAMRKAGWLRLGFNPSYAADLLRFGLPLIPHMLGGILMAQTDRFLITNLVGVDETGLYTVGYQLALVVDLVALSFNNAYAPWLFRKLAVATPGMKRQLVRGTYVQFAAMATLALGVAIGMPWLAEHFLGDRFTEAGRFVGWFALGFLFNGLYYMVTNYIFFAQRTRWLATVTIAVAVINVPVTYLLITVNGGLGAAQATAVSLGLSFVLTWIVSQRVYPMPWLAALRKAGG